MPTTLGIAVLVLAGLTASCMDTPFAVRRIPLGGLRVITTTSGADLDPDGYSLSAARGFARVRVGVNDNVLIGNLRADSYTVLLNEVAANCAMRGGSRTVTVIDRDTVDVVFAGSCSALANLAVTVTTSGIDPDPNGYRVSVESEDRSIRTHPLLADTATFRVPAGEYAVTLTDVAANCDATDRNPRTIPAGSGGTPAITFQVACTPVTRLAFTSARDHVIYAINSNGTGATAVTDVGSVDEDPAWSPDGSKIAFTSKRDGNAEIYVMNADGSSPLRLTTGTRPDYQPAWAPDGSRIVFVSERDGNSELYVMDADGTNPVRLTVNGDSDTDPAWSPDGRRIAFKSLRDGNGEIYVMNADGSGAIRVTTFPRNDFSPAWSPDGTRLAFARECFNPAQCGFSTIVVMNMDGSGEIGIIAGSDPAWSPDGRKIAYVSGICAYYYYYGCEIAGLRIIGADGKGDVALVDVFAANPAWRR